MFWSRFAAVWPLPPPTLESSPLAVFDSPPLTPGNRYSYEVKARWNENGQVVAQTQQVEVAAGTRVNVHFPVQPVAAPAGPNH